MQILANTLWNLAVGLALLGGAGCALAIIILALMNLNGVLDPRMGQAVKGGLLRVFLSLALIVATVAAGSAGITAMVGTGG